MKIGIAGFGDAGRHYADAMRALGMDVVAIGDPAEDRFQAATDLRQEASVFRSCLDLARYPSLGALVLTPDAPDHELLARIALESGKHVLCDPLAIFDSDDARALFWLAQRRDRILEVANPAVDQRAFRVVAESVHDSASPLRALAARRCVDRIDTDDDRLWNLIARDLSRFLEIAGAPVTWMSITGDRNDNTTEWEHLSVTLLFGDGPLAQIEVMLAEDDPRNELVAQIDGLRFVVDESGPEVTELRLRAERAAPPADEVFRFPVRDDYAEICARFLKKAKAAPSVHSERAIQLQVVTVIEVLREQTAEATGGILAAPAPLRGARLLTRAEDIRRIA